ncbi:hypothetical protein Nepgr_010197 [Nepenthes gracilis]|uniref:RING-CH-type domain-containing protein n=1 Tax=Nepenthes gracilis TaxID=150966 RepID=A0AAD3SCY7_NEPGR|nr:hypothetical protein Nepgr_010197 [Nepenthes gracilis]
MQTPQEINGLVSQNSPKGDLQTVKLSSEEVLSSGSSGKNPNLCPQIPPRPIDSSRDQCSPGSLQSQISSKDGSSSSGGLLRGLSYMKRNILTVGGRSSLLKAGSREVSGSPTLPNAMCNFSWQRCTSLPVAPASESSPSASTSASATTAERGCTNTISRSLSVPARNIVIIRSLSSASMLSSKEHLQFDNCDEKIAPVTKGGDDDEEIPKEAAICRICLEACEAGDTFKMECSCKGDLRLVHKECLVKWFSIRRNRNCDVCGQEVLNFPVTLLRVPPYSQRNNVLEQNHQADNSQRISVWHDFMMLALIGTICYFFFLEQLLIQKMKHRAVVIAAPFSLALGLAASVLAVTLAIREHAWTFAAIEFALVAIIIRVLYTALHINAIYAIMLSAFLGFGTAMSLNSLYIHLFAQRVQVAGNSNPA